MRNFLSGVLHSQRGLITRSFRTSTVSAHRMNANFGCSRRVLTPQAIGMNRSMFIQTEKTPNEASIKFIPGVPVMTNGGGAEFLDDRSSLSSPLAHRLMIIDGVKSVFFGPDFVTVSKSDDYPWPVVKPEVFSILMEHFSSNVPLFRNAESELDSGPLDTRIDENDSEAVAMIKELLDTRVRPSIMQDGGDIEYKDFDESNGIVKLKLKGSCRGCASSASTLKGGIERMLMHYISEVKSVEQVQDIEDQIAINEFERLESRLRLKRKNEGNSRVEESPETEYISV